MLFGSEGFAFILFDGKKDLLLEGRKRSILDAHVINSIALLHLQPSTRDPKTKKSILNCVRR